jgi:hypothetical protein
MLRYTYISCSVIYFWCLYFPVAARSQAWVCGRSLRVQIPPTAWMSVSCQCCVFTGRGLCDEPITRPEGSHRAWCASLWVILKSQQWSGLRPQYGCCATGRKNCQCMQVLFTAQILAAFKIKTTPKKCDSLVCQPKEYTPLVMFLQIFVFYRYLTKPNRLHGSMGVNTVWPMQRRRVVSVADTPLVSWRPARHITERCAYSTRKIKCLISWQCYLIRLQSPSTD